MPALYSLTKSSYACKHAKSSRPGSSRAGRLRFEAPSCWRTAAFHPSEQSLSRLSPTAQSWSLSDTPRAPCVSLQAYEEIHCKLGVGIHPEWPKSLSTLVHECCAISPLARPTFKEVLHRLASGEV